MFKSVMLASVLLAAPALAQSGAAPPSASPDSPNMQPPPEFIAAAQAFGTCMSTAGPKVTASMTPEAGAAQMLGECAAPRAALDARFEAWVATPSFPDAGRATAREQYKAQMANLPTQIAEGIRQSRANAAAAPTPAPSATPTPRSTPTPAPSPSPTPKP